MVTKAGTFEVETWLFNPLTVAGFEAPISGRF